MYAAFLYLDQVKQGKHDLENSAQKAYMNKISTRIFELIAFIVMLMTSYIGANPSA